MRYFLLLILLLTNTAHAAVYKCTAAGKTTYTDRPCDASAQAATLPALTTTQAVKAPDLAKAYDQRLKRETSTRDQADAAFLKQHAASKQREAKVCAAIIDHRVIKGMTGDEVRRVLGEADEKSVSGSWLYHRDGKAITVNFDNDGVSGVTSKSDLPKKSRRRR